MHRLCLVPTVVLCLLVNAALFAQTGEIAGKVTDYYLGHPLASVNLSLEGTNFGAATSKTGQYVIENVPPGQYVVVVSRIGYREVRKSIRVQPRQVLQLDFELVVKPVEFEEIVVERTSLIGNKDRLFKVPGSAHFLDSRDLRKFEYNDIHRALSEVPGVNIQEEDGYGLRPNIGLRGTGSERSSKISIMEDGILQAPAPYAAPAAYYFPTVARMNGIEVRKGSSQIKYGPFTTGGALNLISTPIPEHFSGYVRLSAGSDQNRAIHATAGNSLQNVGFLVETFQENTDGFKELDGGGNTGYDKKDYLFKLRLNTNPTAPIYQQLTLKLSQTDETSNETYLGLIDADFARNPVRRYAGSQKDMITTSHLQFLARHFIKPADAVDLTTSFYRTEFDRNWYKLTKIKAGPDAAAVGIADILEDPETYAAEYRIATGETSPNEDALMVKANNRSYYATGVQTQLGLRFKTFGATHQAEFGLRYHEDAMDRFQWVDAYRMVDGVMELTRPGTPGTESNRIDRARAWAGYAQFRFEFGRLQLMPGIRYEHIKLTRRDFGQSDPERTGVNLKRRENRVHATIPGIGMDYKFTPYLSAFFGVHKGFAPPGSREGTRPESSTNYELGLRVNEPFFNFTGVVFFNDYSNLLGVDLNAAGGTGTGDQFNGGNVDVYGLELSGQYDLFGGIGNPGIRLPLRLSYTFTEAKFRNTFASAYKPWGKVESGDELPYVPRHQLFASAGLELQKLSLNLSAKYLSRMRTEAGRGPISPERSTDAYLVFDASTSLEVARGVSLFATVRNLTNQIYIVARRPAGVRPGLPRKFVVGIRTQF